MYVFIGRSKENPVIPDVEPVISAVILLRAGEPVVDDFPSRRDEIGQGQVAEVSGGGAVGHCDHSCELVSLDHFGRVNRYVFEAGISDIELETSIGSLLDGSIRGRLAHGRESHEDRAG